MWALRMNRIKMRGDILASGYKTAGKRAMFVSSSPEAPREREIFALEFLELPQYSYPRLLRVLSSSQAPLPF